MVQHYEQLPQIEQPDVVMLQEHHLLADSTKANDLQAWCAKRGWVFQPLSACSSSRSETGTFGGVGYLWKQHVAVMGKLTAIEEGRSASLMVHTQALGPIQLVTVYIEVGKTMHSGNSLHMDLVLEAMDTSAAHTPWWQVTSTQAPKTSATGWRNRAGMALW